MSPANSMSAAAAGEHIWDPEMQYMEYLAQGEINNVSLTVEDEQDQGKEE